MLAVAMRGGAADTNQPAQTKITPSDAVIGRGAEEEMFRCKKATGTLVSCATLPWSIPFEHLNSWGSLIHSAIVAKPGLMEGGSSSNVFYVLWFTKGT